MLLENELSSITKPTKGQPPPKVTRALIDASKTKPEQKKEKEPVETHLTVPLVENINRVAVEGEEARSVTEAIAILRYRDYYVYFVVVFPKSKAIHFCTKAFKV